MFNRDKYPSDAEMEEATKLLPPGTLVLLPWADGEVTNAPWFCCTHDHENICDSCRSIAAPWIAYIEAGRGILMKNK